PYTTLFRSGTQRTGLLGHRAGTCRARRARPRRAPHPGDVRRGPPRRRRRAAGPALCRGAGRPRHPPHAWHPARGGRDRCGDLARARDRRPRLGAGGGRRARERERGAQRPARAAAPARPTPHGAHCPRTTHRHRAGGAMSIAVEIAVEDPAGLEVAAHAGADRVELCVDLARGGLTPPPELVEACTSRAAELVAARDAKPHFDVHVLIRSRAEHGDFLDRPEEFAYSAEEIALMARQAEEAVTAGAAGVVIGALTADGELDVPAIET